VDRFVFFGAVPAVVSVRDATVADEAQCEVDTANGRSGSARQSIRLDHAAEWVLSWEFVVKRYELPL